MSTELYDNRRAKTTQLVKRHRVRGYKAILGSRVADDFMTTNECDVMINCPCGKQVQIWSSENLDECECGRVYRVHQRVEQLTVKRE